MTKLSIVLGNGGSLVRYPQGGGHWSWFLQYLLGLRALRHDVFWLETFRSTGEAERDRRLITVFCKRLEKYGFKDRFALVLYDQKAKEPCLEESQVYGASKREIREIARDADMLWNVACGLERPFLYLFKRRVLIDVDPGHLQVGALTWDMGIQDHCRFLTVGKNVGESDCAVPTLGFEWHRFAPFVYRPMWNVAPNPGPDAPFSSVTEWGWEELEMEGRRLSVSKREAYLRYQDFPRKARRPFELAVNIDPDDVTGDRELLLHHGWVIVDPHRVAKSPKTYQDFIHRSRAEFLCPKPIHRELKTGWFSDRSAAYLASGRPVLAEDTGFSKYLPVGKGLISFRDETDALQAVADIDGNYEAHMRAARELAEAYLDSKTCLESMISACG